MKLTLKRRPRDLASQCERRRTPQGRIAHLWRPDRGPLCPFGAAASDPAEPGLPLCEICRVVAGLPRAAA